MVAAQIVHKILASVAVANRELGTFKVIAPPINSDIMTMASPTDFISVVFAVLNPMSWIMTVENEFTTPLGIAAANTDMKRRIALGSLNVLRACFLLKVLFLIPIWFCATRLTASTRSRLVRKKAEAGESGKTKKTTKAQKQVAAPRT